MTPELTALALAGLLQAGQFALFAMPANIELTPAYTTGPRIDSIGATAQLSSRRQDGAHFP